jgi:hypothetical protein
MAFSSSPNPGVVGEDAMQAIEHDPRHADNAVSEDRAEVAAEDLVEDVVRPAARPRRLTAGYLIRRVREVAFRPPDRSVPVTVRVSVPARPPDLRTQLAR